MRADDRPQLAKGGRRRVLRPHLPDDVARSLRNDEDHRPPIVGNDVLRMKALVARVVPAVGPQARDGVQKYAVLILAPAHGGAPLAENQGVPAIDQGLHPRNVVADRSPFPREVMVLPRGPYSFTLDLDL